MVVVVFIACLCFKFSIRPRPYAALPRPMIVARSAPAASAILALQLSEWFMEYEARGLASIKLGYSCNDLGGSFFPAALEVRVVILHQLQAI